jgi:hypothetical protein
MADEPAHKRVPIQDLKEGEEVQGSIFPLDPAKGVSTVRVSASALRVVKFNPATEGTIMCGW